MLREIGSFLSLEGKNTVFVLLLWIILYDEKALPRIQKGKTKLFLYIAILVYFLLLLVDVIKIIMKYSS